ncbi:lycopene cyclase domain-containing protein [Candidatus Roizmanbacteria bacterium]|nr:lycopene cyclase domain-containing protein [Candidatus Roizmanbacteria bacterium]
MKEYLILDIIALVGVIILDHVLKTHIIKQKRFWVLQIIVAGFATLVDNYISGRPFVLFSSVYSLNVKVGFVPIENYLFGFCLITLNVILFEYFKRKT